MNIKWLWPAALAWVASTCTVVGQTDWPYLKLTPVVTGASGPTHVTHAGDGSGRLFVVEQSGLIRIVRSNQFLGVPFLDIRTRVKLNGEQGLLSMAFPLGNNQKGHFYVNYTRVPDGATVVSSFQIGADPDQADASTERVILTIPHPSGGHNGGQIAFGPDSFLYVGIGDGDTGNPQVSQDPTSLLGKMLRVDVENVANGYLVPPSNPFVSNPNYRPEIWAMGLRNPWRFSFDKLTGDLLIADVGGFAANGTSREEIDFQAMASSGGENYGWPMKEGSVDTSFFPAGDTNQLTAPVFEYGADQLSKCVIGGFVYRGPASRMTGLYFYGDFVNGGIHALNHTGTNWQQQLLMPGYQATSFGEDENGRVHLAGLDGTIYRLEDSGQPFPPAFDPLPQNVTNADLVTITTLTPGAVIHYTTNGNDPNAADPVVQSGEKVLVAERATLKARAFRADLQSSDITIATYTNYGARLPTIMPASGPIPDDTAVTISTITPGATIRYTLDDTDPGPDSAVYVGPIPFNNSFRTVKAKAFLDGYLASPIAQEDFLRSIYDNAVVTTLAGSGTYGSADGIGTNSQFASPSCVHLDGNGNLLVGELRGAIRKISPAGEVTTLLSHAVVTNTFHMDDISLRDLCIDTDGAIFLVAGNDWRIWKLDPTGQLSSFAGSGLSGNLDGPTAEAQFESPRDLAIDSQHNLYVTDAARIRKIAQANLQVTTIVSDDPPFTTYSWFGLAVDEGDQLFSISDGAAYRIRTDGVLLARRAGGIDGWDGIGYYTSTFSESRGAAADRLGNFYTCSWSPSGAKAWIRLAHRDGLITTLAGSPTWLNDLPYQDGTSMNSEFSGASGLCVATNGVVYVADTSNNVIRKITPADWDEDGIPDALEGGTTPYIVGVDDRLVDSDADGMSNAAEFVAGTDPTDRNSRLVLEVAGLQTDGSILFSWATVSGKVYNIQSSSDVMIWNTVVNGIQGSGQPASFTVAPSTTNQFFRLGVQNN